MNLSRRHFLGGATAVAAGFVGLRQLFSSDPQPSIGYGALIPDSKGAVDLPKGFSYSVISRCGDPMHDGFVVPDWPDGMGAFSGPDDKTIIICNHELMPNQRGPFGDRNELFSEEEKAKIYDAGEGKTPGLGGTTTIVFDTKTQTTERQFLSLAGTYRNCSGGPTPWNTWLTCEEATTRAGKDEHNGFVAEKDHGYVFEVHSHAEPRLSPPHPLKAMGRFNHEAVAVQPETSFVFETEDRDDGLFYRFIPNRRGEMAAGGRLQALKIVDKPSADTRNWESEKIEVGSTMAVEWIDLNDVDSPNDDLRYQGFEAGAARFARGEGIWYGNGAFYFACTNGGRSRTGQIFRFVPSPVESMPNKKKQPDTLELFIEPNDSKLLEAADNLTVAPWGDLILCEDRQGDVVRLVGVTPNGELYTFAHQHLHTEFAGAVFSPDGSTLFVNIQGAGLTLAITGPWKSASS